MMRFKMCEGEIAGCIALALSIGAVAGILAFGMYLLYYIVLS
jgi:hypothetical protein